MALIRTNGSQDMWNNDKWTFLVLKTWQQTLLDSYEALYDSTWFTRNNVSRKSTSGMMNRQQEKRKSNRQHFQPTLHSLPEVKICEVMIQFTNRFLFSRITNTKDESTQPGCTGQPSIHCKVHYPQARSEDVHYSLKNLTLNIIIGWGFCDIQNNQGRGKGFGW